MTSCETFESQTIAAKVSAEFAQWRIRPALLVGFDRPLARWLLDDRTTSGSSWLVTEPTSFSFRRASCRVVGLGRASSVF